MIALLVFLCGIAANAKEITDFSEFMAAYGKSYGTKKEYLFRKQIFDQRIVEFQVHNADPSNTWTKGVNKFADWTETELKSLRGLDMRFRGQALKSQIHVKSNKIYADSKNWCEGDNSACTPIKNQAACGSCWSFSGVESIESNVFVETGQLPILAPQEFVDCMPNPRHCGGTGGCQGATSDMLFNYSIMAGVAAEAAYPYRGHDQACRLNDTKTIVKIKGYKFVENNNEDALMDAINQQPISVNVDASHWSFYRTGVVKFSKNQLDLDHAVQLVGYGTDRLGNDYWLVRNSWGPSWGMKGFIKLARSTECGIDPNNMDGVGCDGDPKTVKVCGTNGILYAASYPFGGQVVQ